MTDAPAYSAQVVGYTGLKTRQMLIELINFGLHSRAFTPHSPSDEILNYLESNMKIKIGRDVRAECLETISKYTAGLRATPRGVPVN